ncbi:MAG TPA: DUF962 domain-containing protein [Bdellovibrionota bacterium]|jgi:hypothetical protein|nr:DUF962 domain-containing protein [Bdellovibrionota bacterium]
MNRFKDFRSFYPHYLGEHRKPATRVLHFLGTTLFLGFGLGGIAAVQPLLVLLGAVLAYAFAWTGHFFVEKNRPATFRHPWYSLIADFRFYGEVLTGRRSLFRD